jgi:hypothetical protein
VRDSTITVIAIVGGFAVLSGAVVYASIRIARSIDQAHEPQGAATDPGPATLNEHGIPVDRVMTYDFFARHWRPAFAERAERACWLPLEQTKKVPFLPSHILFEVEVEADGSVVAVRPYHQEDVVPGISELRTCVTGIIETMKFEPPGKRQSGPVQADRPQKH